MENISFNVRIVDSRIVCRVFFQILTKKVEDKELGKASDIKDKETLKRKGQTIEEQGEVNPDMGGQNQMPNL